jgi:SAM-dependent methyltransferase
MTSSTAIEDIQGFWQASACGDRYAEGNSLRDQLEAQARAKYELEPYIHPFAKFTDGTGRRVLEIGVGMGADHAEWARSRPSYLAGVDLTDKAVELTRARLSFAGLISDLRQANAEALPFEKGSFDIVYSWGVLHHSPDPQRAIDEVWRVLRPSGRARVMLYHREGMVFLLGWMLHKAKRGRQSHSLDAFIASNVESPGTRAYSVDGARRLFSRFESCRVVPTLTHADLLEGDVGRRHRGRLLTFAKRIWPRRLIRQLPGRFGSDLLIEATK